MMKRFLITLGGVVAAVLVIAAGGGLSSGTIISTPLQTLSDITNTLGNLYILTQSGFGNSTTLKNLTLTNGNFSNILTFKSGGNTGSAHMEDETLVWELPLMFYSDGGGRLLFTNYASLAEIKLVHNFIPSETYLSVSTNLYVPSFRIQNTFEDTGFAPNEVLQNITQSPGSELLVYTEQADATNNTIIARPASHGSFHMREGGTNNTYIVGDNSTMIASTETGSSDNYTRGDNTSFVMVKHNGHSNSNHIDVASSSLLWAYLKNDSKSNNIAMGQEAAALGLLLNGSKSNNIFVDGAGIANISMDEGVLNNVSVGHAGLFVGNFAQAKGIHVTVGQGAIFGGHFADDEHNDQTYTVSDGELYWGNDNARQIRVTKTGTVEQQVNNAPVKDDAALMPLPMVVQTNFLLNTVYTTGVRVESVKITAILNEAVVVGVVGLALCDDSGGTWHTNSLASSSTLLTSIVTTLHSQLEGFVPTNSHFYFTNISSGSGNSSAIHINTGQRVAY